MTSGLFSSLLPSTDQPPRELQEPGWCLAYRDAGVWPSAPPSECGVLGEGTLSPPVSNRRRVKTRAFGKRIQTARPGSGFAGSSLGIVDPHVPLLPGLRARASAGNPEGARADRPRRVPGGRCRDPCSRRLRLRLCRGRCFLIGVPFTDMAAVAFGWAHCGCPESPGRARWSKARPRRRGAVGEA